MSEKQFQSQILQLAHLAGWAYYHTHNSRHSVSGFPDLVLVRGKTLIFAELKVGRNKPSTEQARWLDLLRQTGVIVRLWRPEHWDEIQEMLLGGNIVPDVS